MAIGLTAKQRKELAAMAANVDDSVASLKRLITDAKDRERAIAKLKEAEEAHRKHAREVGIPFNEAAFVARRAELDALPTSLTIEDGQLAAFSSLQRAIAAIVEGPYVRPGRGVKRKRGKAAGGSSAVKRSAPSGAKSSPRSSGGRGSRGAVVSIGRTAKPAGMAAIPTPLSSPMKRIKPLPLALGS